MQGKPRLHSETSLTIYVADYLRGEIRNGKNVIRVPIPFPSLLWAFVANEGRSEADGAKFKRMGVRRGMADIIAWQSDKSYAIELKSPTGTQSLYQKDFMQKFRREGGEYALARSVAEVRNLFVAWGLKCENPNCVEPPPTFEEKVAYSQAMFGNRDKTPLPVGDAGAGFVL